MWYPFSNDEDGGEDREIGRQKLDYPELGPDTEHACAGVSCGPAPVREAIKDHRTEL